MLKTESHSRRDRRRPILFDLTLSFRSMGDRPTGILRTERAYARAALARTDLDVTFCRFDPHSGSLHRVSRADVATILDYRRPAGPRPPKGLRKTLTDLLAMLRHRDVRRYRMLRWNLKRLFPLRSLSGRIEPAAVAPGTVYVLAGLSFDHHTPDWIDRFKRDAGVSIYAICYDLLPVVHPDYFQSDAVVERFRGFTSAMLDFADGIASISRATQADLIRFAQEAGKSPPPLQTLTLGTEVQPAPKIQPADLAMLRTRDFVLCVGTINIRKNHELLYQLWARLSEERNDLPKLVFAGAVGWRIGDLLDRLKADPRTRETIVLAHDLDDAALAWAYANCLFTVYPSFYEGWGLPVSESLTYGRYCLTSSTSSMPEAGAGLALTLDPNDLEAWHREISALLDDRSRLEALEQSIQETYRPTTWAQSADVFFGQVLSTGADAPLSGTP